MARNVKAWELNDLYVRVVRHMLATNDFESLLETGTGTPDEAALLVRCYELAAMELWDVSALVDAAMVAGLNAGFSLAGESRENITRKLSIAVKSGRVPELMGPPDGIKFLYQIGVLMFDELEQTVSHFAEIGRYETDTKPQADTPPQAAPEPAPVVQAPESEPRPAATGPTFAMIKTAMIEQHEHEWPTIRRDITDAKRNGLSDAAKAGVRGWHETKAMEWARCNGKLTSTEKPGNAHAGVNSMFNLPTSRKHRLEG